MSTKRAFTLVVCVGCGAPPDDPWMDRLRAVVRLFPHGMLVSTTCLLGSVFCATRPGGGVIAMFQPCTADRSPAGPACWIGPIADDADVVELCDWIIKGDWRLPALTPRLQNPLRHVTHASQHN